MHKGRRTGPARRATDIRRFAVALSAALIAVATASMLATSSQALPAYAARTGLPCARCHINPSGGGPRTAFGRAFAANGHHLPGKRRHARHSFGGNYRSGGAYDGGMMGGYGHGMMGGGGMMGGWDNGN